MTPEKRQALRDKHAACFADTYKDQYVCRSCSSNDVSTRLVYYPCDVIKVLDAYDELHEGNKKTLETLTVTLNLVQQLAKVIP